MRIRSFIIAYSFVLAILLFADRRPGPSQRDRYSHVIDLTDAPNSDTQHGRLKNSQSKTRIIAPAALIPGTWSAAQIPAERLVAPLIVMDLITAPDGVPQISLDDISAWEIKHGMIPQGAVIAVRLTGTPATSPAKLFPVQRDAAQFLIDARYATGFMTETAVDFTADRTLAQQLALHGSYVVEGAAPFSSLPATGSLIIVAPAKTRNQGEAPVRILAMVQ